MAGTPRKPRGTPRKSKKTATARTPGKGALASYRAKRDFSRTVEPRGGRSAPGGTRFVIQKHAATRLHYDLRLELDGVLKSWAVAKGPSLDPKERRLAMRTEDHPLDYGAFEGLIPKGEYGGGAVIVWDHGTWVPMADPHDGLAKGLIKFRLSGEKLGGGWSLVKLKKTSPRDDPDNAWLLVKERDIFADAKHDVLVSKPESVLSGRTVEEVAAEDAASARAPAKKPRPTELKGARRDAIVVPPRPQLPSLVAAPPSGPGWLHEIKHDGYRTLAVKERGGVRLFTRNGHDWTERYASLAASLAALPCRDAIIDGEVAVQDEAGVTRFSALQDALAGGTTEGLVFFAFDLLHLDGHDLSDVILIERKSALEGLLAAAPASCTDIVFSDHVIGQGAGFHAQAVEMGLEGIVSKKVDAHYRAGRSDSWRKIKSVRSDGFVIIGFTESDAAGGLASLLVAEPGTDGLTYVGKVGTGFTPKGARQLARTLRRLARKTAPIAIPKGALKGPRPSVVTWVTPRLVADVAYRARTGAGMLRAASFKGLRDDAAAAPETVALTGEPEKSTPQPPERPERPERKRYVTDADLATVWITNPDRRMFGRDGPTKLDLALYYARIGDWMLPHIVGRPVTLVRCPTGKVEDCFYQRHAMPGMPDSVKRVALAADGDAARADYLAIEDAKGLLALAQFGVIEFHPWGCRVDKPERPDRLVLDLDPDEGLRWRAVADAARDVRDALDEIGLVAFLKTTGGKGLHVVVPIERRLTWPAFKGFAHGFVRALAERAPRRYTTSPQRARRRGRLYLDYLRNTRGATAVAPYSLRARAGVPVALPIPWDALDEIEPAALTAETVPDRLADADDPWQEMERSARAVTKRMLETFRAGA